jgi:hypothetical protein
VRYQSLINKSCRSAWTMPQVCNLSVLTPTPDARSNLCNINGCVPAQDAYGVSRIFFKTILTEMAGEFSVQKQMKNDYYLPRHRGSPAPCPVASAGRSECWSNNFIIIYQNWALKALFFNVLMLCFQVLFYRFAASVSDPDLHSIGFLDPNTGRVKSAKTEGEKNRAKRQKFIIKS